MTDKSPEINSFELNDNVGPIKLLANKVEVEINNDVNELEILKLFPLIKFDAIAAVDNEFDNNVDDFIEPLTDKSPEINSFELNDSVVPVKLLVNKLEVEIIEDVNDDDTLKLLLVIEVDVIILESIDDVEIIFDNKVDDFIEPLTDKSPEINSFELNDNVVPVKLFVYKLAVEINKDVNELAILKLLPLIKFDVIDAVDNEFDNNVDDFIEPLTDKSPAIIPFELIEIELPTKLLVYKLDVDNVGVIKELLIKDDVDNVFVINDADLMSLWTDKSPEIKILDASTVFTDSKLVFNNAVDNELDIIFDWTDKSPLINAFEPVESVEVTTPVPA